MPTQKAVDFLVRYVRADQTFGQAIDFESGFLEVQLTRTAVDRSTGWKKSWNCTGPIDRHGPCEPDKLSCSVQSTCQVVSKEPESCHLIHPSRSTGRVAIIAPTNDPTRSTRAETATTIAAVASILARRPTQNGSDSPGSIPQIMAMAAVQHQSREPGAQSGHLPLNAGLRFSLKARMPSR